MTDGAASISASMLVAVLINVIQSLSSVWGLRFLQELTFKEDGVIVVATLLLLPTSFLVYGGSQVIFAAKEAVEKRAMEKGRREGHRDGLQEGRQEGLQAGRQEGRQEGLQEGREEGLQAGRQEGRQEGLQEGLQEGQQKERERIAQALEQHGVDLPPELARIIARESD